MRGTPSLAASGAPACARRQRHRRAIDYSLNRWTALTAYLLDGNVAIDNNHIENLMRPWARGRKAWLFAGSELAGQRAAVVMSLMQSARMHGLDPWTYLKDVLTRLPGHLNSRIDEAAAPSLAACRLTLR